MSVVTQLYFQIVEEINYMFRPFSRWAIIRLRLEYQRDLVPQFFMSTLYYMSFLRYSSLNLMMAHPEKSRNL
jgi:hypothetical protein